MESRNDTNDKNDLHCKLQLSLDIIFEPETNSLDKLVKLVDIAFKPEACDSGFNNKLVNRDTKKNFFYDIFWKILLNKNINRVFGLPAGGKALLNNLLSYKPNKIIWTNHGSELQNGFAAQLYGEYTNSVGYLFTTIGPGIATAISALQQAIYEEKPLIMVSTIDTNDNVGDFQTWDIKNIAKNITDHFFYIKNENDIFTVMDESYNTAKKYNTGVILLIDQNIFVEKMYKIPKNNKENEIFNKCDRNNKLLLINSLKEFQSKNILLVIGRLKHIHYSSLFQFIKVNKLPFVTTWKGRFYLKKYGLSCGRIGTLGKHCANYALYNATHLLVIGNVSGKLNSFQKNFFSVVFTKDKHIISLSYNKKFSLKSNDIYEINDLSFILENLILQANNNWVLKLEKSNTILDTNLPRISRLEKFAYIASIVYKNNNLNIPISIDVGKNWYAIGKYMDTEHPNCFESATNWASMGIAISNGIAIHYATNKQVWVFIGDGGLLFSSSDLLYLLSNKHLPITVTIYVNNIYGSINEELEMNADKEYKKIIEIPNIPIINILPNCHIFYNENTYYEYLNNNYYSDELRFIIIMLPNTNSENLVYEINADKEYEENLKNSKFENILNTKMKLYQELRNLAIP
jgi:thiamine pyrophosphate-dependent acetolactate synthase large subunit-like protein